MFSIPILIPDEVPCHTRRTRHPCSAQRMCPRSSQCMSSFPGRNMTPPAIHPMWMFQPDAFQHSPVLRPCQSRSPLHPKQEHFDFAQKLVTNLFDNLLQTDKEEVERKEEKKKQNACKENMSGSGPRECSGEKSKNQFADFLVDALKGFNARQQPVTKKWRHIVDCSGFKSENIYVKVLEGSIVVRGEKEEHGNDGCVSVTSIEKQIKLPQNLEAKKVSCRLLPHSRLLIEAPYGDARKERETSPPAESLPENSPSCSEEMKDDSISEDALGETDPLNTVQGEKSNDEAENTSELEDTNTNNEEDNVKSQISNTTEESFVLITENEKNEEDISGDKPKTEDVDEMHIEKANSTQNISGETVLDSLQTSSDQNIEEAFLKTRNQTTPSENSYNEETTEHTKEFQIRLELTCHNPESIRVTMDDQTRHINIDAKKDGGNASESVHKEVSVPDSVDVAQLRCHFQDGLLTIVAPYYTTPAVSVARNIPVNM